MPNNNNPQHQSERDQERAKNAPGTGQEQQRSQGKGQEKYEGQRHDEGSQGQQGGGSRGAQDPDQAEQDRIRQMGAADGSTRN